MAIKTKPNRTANALHYPTETVIENYPAYKGDNDRYVATVPMRTGGKPHDAFDHVNISHQPSGSVIAFNVPFREIRRFTKACMTLLGDCEDTNQVITNFCKLSTEQKHFIRNFNFDGKRTYPEGL